VPDLLSELADGLGALVGHHLTLARLELAQDARELGVDVGQVVAFVSFLGVGYLFLCAAGAAGLALHLGWPLALGAVALFNFALGGAGVLWVLARIRRRRTPVLGESTAELRVSAQAVVHPLGPLEGTRVQ
jgi:hypothetical protein